MSELIGRTERTGHNHTTAAYGHPIHWGILTPEFPPGLGGVSDYSGQLARALAASGDSVAVWTPQGLRSPSADSGVVVRSLPGRFGFRGRTALSGELSTLPREARILVQYVPHGLGYKGLNLPLIRLLSRHTLHPLDVMYHEVAFPRLPKASLRHRLLSSVQFRMARTLAARADRVFVPTSAWTPLIEGSMRPEVTATWLPVPSNLPTEISEADCGATRARIASESDTVIGHFSTYGDGVMNLIRGSLPKMLTPASRRICVLMGRGANTARAKVLEDAPELAPLVVAFDDVPRLELARVISACDAMLQPYPDGVSGRRTTVMAALALGIPTITTSGPLTEDTWKTSGAVALAPSSSPSQLAAVTEQTLLDPGMLRRLGDAGRTLYRDQFAVEHTIERLRNIDAADTPRHS